MKFNITAAALAVSVFAASVANAATTTGSASATVIGPLSVTQQTAMNFGSFSSSATAGTINSFGAVTGGVTAISLGSPAIFNATGNPNSSFFITGSPTATLTNGANSMIATLTMPASSAFDNTGARIFNVTGVLAVAANQVAGTYTGTYTVNVNY